MRSSFFGHSVTPLFSIAQKHRGLMPFSVVTKRCLAHCTQPSLFSLLDPAKLTPTFKHPISGRKYLPGSGGKGFPKFLAGPRADLPYTLEVRNPDMFSIQEWAAHCRSLLDKKLPSKGGVLFRGLPLKEGKDFSSFTKNLGYNAMDYSGGTGNRPYFDENATVYISTLDPKEFTIEPHNEMACSTVHPKKVVFFCDIEPGEDCGGLTAIARNSEVFAKLDPKVVQELKEKNVRYSRYLPSTGAAHAQYVSWQSSFYTQDPKEVEKFLRKAEFSYKWNKKDDSLLYWYTLPPFIKHQGTGEKVWFTQPDSHHSSYFKESPMFDGVVLSDDSMYPAHATYGDGTEIEPEVIQHIRATNWNCAVGFQWRTGDIVVLDNLAVMHSRLSFTGKRRILSFLTSN